MVSIWEYDIEENGYESILVCIRILSKPYDNQS